MRRRVVVFAADVAVARHLAAPIGSVFPRAHMRTTTPPAHGRQADTSAGDVDSAATRATASAPTAPTPTTAIGGEHVSGFRLGRVGLALREVRAHVVQVRFQLRPRPEVRALHPSELMDVLELRDVANDLEHLLEDVVVLDLVTESELREICVAAVDHGDELLHLGGGRRLVDVLVQLGAHLSRRRLEVAADEVLERDERLREVALVERDDAVAISVRARCLVQHRVRLLAHVLEVKFVLELEPLLEHRDQARLLRRRLARVRRHRVGDGHRVDVQRGERVDLVAGEEGAEVVLPAAVQAVRAVGGERRRLVLLRHDAERKVR